MEDEQEQVLSERIDAVLRIVREEMIRANTKYGSFQSTHEGQSVVNEEFLEFQHEVFKDNIHDAVKEAVQVSAMAACFVLDFKDNHSREKAKEGKWMPEV